VSRFHSYLNSASSILQVYKGEQPFHIFLRSFFKENKKYGSRDRKIVSHLCYCYFRLGLALQELPIADRLLAGLFLCEKNPNEFFSELQPEWNELIGLPADQKAAMLGFSLQEIFPFAEELSNDISIHDYSASMIIQPDLFIRVRPGYENNVKQKLQEAHVQFNQVTHSCLRLENSIQVDKTLQLNKEVVVQDYNSQRISEFLIMVENYLRSKSNITSERSPVLKIYDCCAASGGKSILAYDYLKPIELTVSDVRRSILRNLKERLSTAGIENYSAFVKDLTLANSKPDTQNLAPESFDLVICDAPCTGSGTWSRTPEQLYYFKQQKIGHYQDLQLSIVRNVAPLVKKGGFLLYITCSVFRKENEDIVNYSREQAGLELEKVEMLKGYDKKADTLFAALLTKK
jgi:16S rRNA (cytosine967-C5)-methyltransferase